MRIVRLILAIALALPVTTAIAAPGATKSAEPASPYSGEAALMQKFFDSDYTLCDAFFVSKTFDFSLSESKVYIGQKIDWSTTSILDDDLKRAREKGMKDRTHRCQYYQTGYSYDDALALAKHWGIDVSEAKTRAEDKILWGNEKYFATQVLPEAKRAYAASTKPAGSQPESEMAHGDELVIDPQDIMAFHNSKYDYCHAKMLVGTYFGSGLEEVKATIGYKVLADASGPIDSFLDKRRAEFRTANKKPCQFHETPYTYDDAVALSTLWGQSVSEVKARIENKYLYGSEVIIREEIDRAQTQ